MSTSTQFLGQRCFHAIFCFQNLRRKQCEPCWSGSRVGALWPPAGHFAASSNGFLLKRQAFIIATASADEACAILKVQDTADVVFFFCTGRWNPASRNLPYPPLQNAVLSAWKYPLRLHRNQQELQLRMTLKFRPSPLPAPLISALWRRLPEETCALQARRKAKQKGWNVSFHQAPEPTLPRQEQKHWSASWFWVQGDFSKLLSLNWFDRNALMSAFMHM